MKGIPAVDAVQSEAVTNHVRVSVTSRYVPEKSNPAGSNYFFAYDVKITNEGNFPLQLSRRYWKIRDAFGRIEEVRGPGVIGRQPRLLPGETFAYSSFCPLNTEFGSMEGHYIMVYDDGTEFTADIARFQLISPQAVN